MLKPTAEGNESDSPAEDEQTLRTLFDSEECNLLRYAFALTRRRVVAEELVQDAFLQLHVKWGEVDSPRAWLVRCIRNQAFNHLRKNKREVMQVEDVSEMEPCSNAPEPDALMQRAERTAALRGLIHSLREADRRLVQWKYFEGLSYREISERSGLTVSNVGFRLHRILKQLASKLKPLGIEDLS